MHFGAHWGLWAFAIVALIVGLFLILRSRRNKKWNWAAAGVLALVLAVGMFARGWTIWPKQTAEHFISVVYDGSDDEVMEMLSEPSQWTVAAGGGLTILAEDSTKVTLSPDTLPLMAASAEKGGVLIPGQVIGEVLAGKLDFTIGTGKKRKCIVHCTAERGSVRIRHVELFDPESPQTVTRDGDATIPGGKYRLLVEEPSDTTTQIVVKVELLFSSSSQQRAWKSAFK